LARSRSRAADLCRVPSSSRPIICLSGDCLRRQQALLVDRRSGPGASGRPTRRVDGLPQRARVSCLWGRPERFGIGGIFGSAGSAFLGSPRPAMLDSCNSVSCAGCFRHVWPAFQPSDHRRTGAQHSGVNMPKLWRNRAPHSPKSNRESGPSPDCNLRTACRGPGQFRG
jgi:hypothetical protein